MVDFYDTLFGSKQVDLNFDDLLGDFPMQTLALDNAIVLNRPFTSHEVLGTVKDIHPTKSLGPDRFHDLFY